MDWDEYFLKITETVALRSKDPSTKTGCVIVDRKHRPVSFGYNGLIQGADESRLTLSERPMKYYYAIHSEMNAILFSHVDLAGCTLYTTYAPCVNCLKYILQAGITRVVYRKLHVESHAQKDDCSMQNQETDQAVIALLESMPQVQTLNIENGLSYAEDLARTQS